MSIRRSRRFVGWAWGCALGIVSVTPLACSSSSQSRHAREESDSGAGGEATEPTEPTEAGGGHGELAGASAGGSEAPAAGMDSGGDAGAGGSSVAPVVESLLLTPSSPELPATLGAASEPLQLTATVTWSDATSTIAEGGTWSTDAPEVAQVDDKGVVTATGARGGIATIHYSLGQLEAKVAVHVQLTANLFEGGVSPSDRAKLDTPSNVDAAAPLWQYPEDQTVFPARMLPPKLQWKAKGNDVFRLALSQGSDVQINVYTTLAAYEPSKAVWAALTSSYGRAIDLGLAGKLDTEGGNLHAAAARSIFAADADLSGLLYYFDVTTSKLSRFALESGSAEPIFPGDQQCRSCHTPARDGSVVAFQYDGGGNNPGGVFSSKDASELLSKGNNNRNWDYATFRPDARAMVTSLNGAFGYFDLSKPASPVGVLNAGPDLAGKRGTQPTWSPDGSTLAFIAHDDASSDWAFVSSELRIAQYDRKTQQFGSTSLLASADASPNDTLTNPSWSPDSRYLAVGVGDKSYAPSNMSLALVDVITKTRLGLQRASAPGVNETPSFAPWAQGGYNWLVFSSNRAYGSVTGSRLFWVAALDQNFKDIRDPSHPAFLVPGQDTSGSHLLPQWAPLACSGHDAACSKDADCCEGLSCSGTADKTCQAVGCSVLGQPCSSNQDCCSIGGVLCRPALDGITVCQR